MRILNFQEKKRIEMEKSLYSIEDNCFLKRLIWLFRFRSTFLSIGSSIPMAETFRKFRGRDPSHEALLLSLGLKASQQPKKKGGSE